MSGDAFVHRVDERVQRNDGVRPDRCHGYTRHAEMLAMASP
jgi:hypothetical protein